MKLIVTNILFLFLFVVMFGYLILPNNPFPNHISDFLVSGEPADVEFDNRRGYFTNETREGVVSYYRSAYSIRFLGFTFYPIRLNYPPEDAQTLIRDQTRSTFLEELVFPFRESLYINGFEPKDDKDAIVVDGIRYRQKIIVKQVKSNIYVRLLLGSTSLLFFYLFINNAIKLIRK